MLIQARNNVTKFQDMEGALNGQIIVDRVVSDFNLLWKNKVLFPNPPSYKRYIEVDTYARKIINFNDPMGNQWRAITKYATNESSLPTVKSSRR